jgi:N-acetylneuraminic acid mutarotase
MNLGRSATHAIPLTTGDVLVVGEDATCDGELLHGGSTSVFAEIYRSGTGTWTTTGSLNAPRGYFAAVPLANGRALITGGVNGDGVSYSSTKIYDETAGTFTQPGLMNIARTAPASALLKDGRVLVAGGTFDSGGSDDTIVLATAEVFDPTTARWSMTTAMHQTRDDPQAVTLADGRVLVVGRDSTNVATAELWDPTTGKWLNAGSLATDRFDFSLVALPDGSALVAGGEGRADVAILSSAERFNPAALSWSSAGNMQTAGASRMATVLANGRVLFAGGWVSAQDYLTAAEVYDPATGSWTPTVPLPHMRADGQAVLLADGSVLIAGGDDGSSVPIGVTGAGDCRRALPEALRYIPAAP